MFYVQLLRTQIPNAQKRQSSQQCHLALLGLKAARKTLVKSTLGQTIQKSKQIFYRSQRVPHPFDDFIIRIASIGVMILMLEIQSQIVSYVGYLKTYFCF